MSLRQHAALMWLCTARLHTHSARLPVAHMHTASTCNQPLPRLFQAPQQQLAPICDAPALQLQLALALATAGAQASCGATAAASLASRHNFHIAFQAKGCSLARGGIHHTHLGREFGQKEGVKLEIEGDRAADAAASTLCGLQPHGTGRSRWGRHRQVPLGACEGSLVCSQKQPGWLTRRLALYSREASSTCRRA